MAAPSSDPVDVVAMNDSEYILDKAYSCLKSSRYECLSWTLTAKSLFPNDLNVLFHVFLIHKESCNISESAKSLQELLAKFPNEERVRSLLSTISGDLFEGNGNENNFYQKLFYSAPKDVQESLILFILNQSGDADDLLSHYRSKILILRKYPQHIEKFGEELIETLLTLDKHGHTHNPLNPYRSLLVHDVLPLVLPHISTDNSSKVIKCFQKAVEYYCVSSSLVKAEGTEKGGLSPDSPFGRLFELTRIICDYLGWRGGECFQANSSPETRYQRLVLRKEECNEDLRPFVFMAVVALLFHVREYVFLKAYSGRVQFALVRHLSFDPVRSSTIKRIRLSPSESAIVCPSGSEHSKSVLLNFKLSVRYWNLLNSTSEPQEEFHRLLQQCKLDAQRLPWLHQFEMDRHIYQENYNEILEVERNLEHHSHCLQTACAAYYLDDVKMAVENLIDSALKCRKLPADSSSGESKLESDSDKGRLELLPLTRQAVMSYCVGSLVTCLRVRFHESTSSSENRDVLLGHLVVLSQFGWPKMEALFPSLIQEIRASRKFTYNLFFSYIINMDMLEEFAFLRHSDAAKVELDILQQSTEIIARSRTFTRGVNREVNEDLKLALQEQTNRSGENVVDLIISFLSKEKESIVSSLLK